MNQLAAARETIELAEQRLNEWTLNWSKIQALDPDLQMPHLKDMLAMMESGVNPQDPKRDFGEAKLGRWLGWMQAACVAMGVFTLADMKMINKKWADK